MSKVKADENYQRYLTLKKGGLQLPDLEIDDFSWVVELFNSDILTADGLVALAANRSVVHLDNSNGYNASVIVAALTEVEVSGTDLSAFLKPKNLQEWLVQSIGVERKSLAQVAAVYVQLWTGTQPLSSREGAWTTEPVLRSVQFAGRANVTQLASRPQLREGILVSRAGRRPPTGEECDACREILLGRRRKAQRRLESMTGSILKMHNRARVNRGEDQIVVQETDLVETELDSMDDGKVMEVWLGYLRIGEVDSEEDRFAFANCVGGIWGKMQQLSVPRSFQLLLR
ncbi:hypothetical protein PHISCL_01182 [Aspergillus sclerotialis]|uniref:Uncharacterized protein n=1 Tax=Aspergillus sclerotialis TaxID=2070753 RepID=A0A3A2ZTJ4_9EURO|nr:hypothetical protein PHISCL_01182 [Aspergillus sclerotialis]